DADIATDLNVTPGGLHHFADQCRGRGFTVGSRDRDDVAFDVAECQLDLTDDRNALFTRFLERRDIWRNAWTHDDLLGFEKSDPRVAAHFVLDSRSLEFFD